VPTTILKGCYSHFTRPLAGLSTFFLPPLFGRFFCFVDVFLRRLPPPPRPYFLSPGAPSGAVYPAPCNIGITAPRTNQAHRQSTTLERRRHFDRRVASNLVPPQTRTRSAERFWGPSCPHLRPCDVYQTGPLGPYYSPRLLRPLFSSRPTPIPPTTSPCGRLAAPLSPHSRRWPLTPAFP